MGKPAQASEDQLNVWLSSLAAGDILATTASRKRKKEQQRAGKSKRPAKEQGISIQDEGGRKHDRKRGKHRVERAREYGRETANHEDTETHTDSTSVAENTKDAEAADAGLRALEMTIENAIDLSLTKKKYKAPYDPGNKKPAASVSKRKLNLQPRRSDYGGIGLARESIYIALDASGWRRKLSKKFVEHIPGFFGKQKTKAMKKQTSGDMLWRQRLSIKQKQDQLKNNDDE